MPSADQPSDHSLVTAILNGEVNQFGLLVSNYKDMIYSICLNLLKVREEAEDQSQEIFVKIFHKLRTYNGKARLSTWIYRMSYNHCLDVLRAQNRLPFSTDIDEEKQDFSDEADDDILEKDWEEEQLISALRSLDPENRNLVLFFYYEDQSVKEIAGITGLSESNVKVKLHRVRALLKQQLETKFEQR